MKAAEVLKTYFGYDVFRKGQEDIIGGILSGRDALAIMPTGAGKSICYQVPALLLPGITLVISPLISLMQDQVKSLNAAGIHAAYINSSLTETQIAKALALALKGVYKIIYVAPERLESAGFMNFALHGTISMVTVDEAHCISQWGQDFRPSYLKIVDFIDGLPERPILSAFTATATTEVKNDIECILKLKEPQIVVTGFDRENLYYSVEHMTGSRKDDFVMEYIKKHSGESGIVYCATRKNVDTLYEKLFRQGVSVTRYHAGIDNETRKKNQDDFIYDRVQVVVATNAFGMGIDKSNVRYVIHYNMPQSMENYYQEAGRAGRDGESSQCILLYSVQDVMIHKYLLARKEFEGMEIDDIELVKQRDVQRLQAMEGYCRTTSCLRYYILEYFGEKVKGACDNCGNCHGKYVEIDMTADAKWVINCIAEAKGRYGLNIVLGALLGANRARLREVGATNYKSYGVLSHRNEKELRLLIDQMLLEGYIIQTQEEYSVLRMGDIRKLKDENTHVLVRRLEERKEAKKSSGKIGKKTDALTGAGYKLFEKLRQLRLAMAKEEALPPYIIFNDKTLIDMCVKMPVNKHQMLTVSGVGENKFHRYGKRFMDEIEAFLVQNPGVILSENLQEQDVDSDLEPERKSGKRQKKGDFRIGLEDAKKFEYADYYYISDIKDKLNDVCSLDNVKKVTIGAIWDCLVMKGLTIEEKREGKLIKVGTDQGVELGIKTVDKISQNGYHYQLLVYPEKVQKLIVEYFIADGDNFLQ